MEEEEKQEQPQEANYNELPEEDKKALVELITDKLV